MLNDSIPTASSNSPAVTPSSADRFRFDGTALKVDADRFRRMPADQVMALMTALSTVADVVSGLSNQPRFCDRRHDGFHGPNLAGNFLEDVFEWIGTAQDVLARVAEDIQPNSPEAAKAKAFARLILLADISDDLVEVMDVATAGLREAEAAARHGVRTRNPS